MTQRDPRLEEIEGRLSKTMAEVLAEHQFMHHSFNGVTQKRYLACSCGESPLAGDHPTHLAAALSAAGYGLVADAWDEGHESGFWNGRQSAGTGEMELCGIEHAKANNPYRKARNDDQ